MSESRFEFLLTDLGYAVEWYLLLTVIGLIFWPLVFLVFRRWPERGLLLSRPLGLLMLGWSAWFLSWAVKIPMSRAGLICLAAVWLVLSAAVAWPRRQRLWREIKSARCFILWAEVLTLFAFFFMVQVRRYDPDVVGTEKYMDLAFFTSLIREIGVPPNDMWLAGGSINYHYGGYFLYSLPAKLTGFMPGYAYNLSVATVFAFAITASLVLGGMLGGRLRWGALTALVTCCIGNLFGLTAVLSRNTGLYVGDFLRNTPPLHSLRYGYLWRASRIIHDGPPPHNETINEFPFFSFVWADLHPHVTAFAWVLVFLALAYCAFQSPIWSRPRLAFRRWLRVFLPLAIMLAVSAAMLPITNLFDLPTFAGVYGLVVILSAFFAAQKLGIERKSSVWLIFMVLAIGCAGLFAAVPPKFFGPDKAPAGFKVAGIIATLCSLGLGGWSFRNYWGDSANGANNSNEQKPDANASSVSRRLRPFSHLIAFMALPALGLAIGAPFWLNYSAPARPEGLLGIAPYRSQFSEFFTVFGFHLTVLLGATAAGVLGERQFQLRKEILAFGAIVCALIFAAMWGLSGSLVAPVLLALLIAGVLWLISVAAQSQPDRSLLFGLTLALMALAIMLACEFFYFVDNYGVKRMNTLFKFHYQAWILLGIALPVLVRHVFKQGSKYPARIALLIPGALLLLGALIVPVSFARTLFDQRVIRIGDGPNAMWRAPNLDGQYYMRHGHADDWYVVDYVIREIPGHPVVLEASGGAYGYESILSANTGTIALVGWKNHENVWRGGEMWGELMERDGVINSIYNAADLDSLRGHFERYGIEYVFVGSVERGRYPQDKLAKFDAWEAVVRSPNSDRQRSSVLYRVPADWLTPANG